MKYVIIVLLIIVAAFALGKRSVMSPTSADITLESIQADLTNGAVLVDVRTPEEFAQEHALGAINLPLDQIQAQNYGDLDTDQKIYVYCRSGNRSAQAAKHLEQAGYENVVDIQSLSNWKSLGGQTE